MNIRSYGRAEEETVAVVTFYLQRCYVVHCYVFVFYNYAVATLVLLPLSLIFRRSRRLPSAKSPVFFKIIFRFIKAYMNIVPPGLASAISNLTLTVIYRCLPRFSHVPGRLSFIIGQSCTHIWGLLIQAIYLIVIAVDMVDYSSLVHFTLGVECVTVGSTTLFKAASLRGLSFYVFVFYTYVVAALVLLPLSLIFGRSRRLPSAKAPFFFKIFLLALLGFVSMLSGCKGVEYSNPTLASAISTLTPAFTFTLAVIFRMERIVLKSSASQAKVIGTIVSISGALVIVLYKGPKLLSSASLTSSSEPMLYQALTSFDSSWIIGGGLLVTQYLLVSLWYILQTQAMEVYPEKTTVVLLYILCATAISAPVCMLAEKDLSPFLLKPGVPLASVMYTGGLVSSLGTVIHTWGLHVKGPVYISLFKPLSIVIAVVMAAIFLGDPLYLGSVIGSVILSCGFYTVIWGKAREDSTRNVDGSGKLPLLVTHTIEDDASSLRCD